MAVGVDSELGDLELFVPNDTLDGSTGLALIIENESLGMKDAPAVLDMRVHADRRGLTARVETGLPDALCGLETHHVGGSQVGAAPRGRDGGAMHELEH